jgi:hypothetical protein
LLSKIQYNNYEPGEFSDDADRTFDQTVQLIESFPWEPQRDHLQVSLTNPSVTLQDNEGNYLKLALYYNGKFVLHYFNIQQELYNKSLNRYTEAYPYLQSFYNIHPFDTSDFHLENTWLQHNRVHFADKDFHYQVTPKVMRSYLLGTSWINFALTLFMIGLFFTHLSAYPVLAIISPYIFFLGGGINLILFFNYNRHVKGKLLIMSKGNDIFYFGPEENPTRFDKKEIEMSTRFQARGSKNPTSSFAWVKITFKNGQALAIPNLLIDDSDLMNKLSGFPNDIVQKTWPSIPRAFSALSV